MRSHLWRNYESHNSVASANGRGHLGPFQFCRGLAARIAGAIAQRGARHFRLCPSRRCSIALNAGVFTLSQ